MDVQYQRCTLLTRAACVFKHISRDTDAMLHDFVVHTRAQAIMYMYFAFAISIQLNTIESYEAWMHLG